MKISSNNILSEEQSYQKSTYENYIKGIKRMKNSINTAYEDILLNLESKSFLITCLGNYYYDKYITELHENLNYFEKALFAHIKNNNINGEDKKMLLYCKSKAEDRINELFEEINTNPNKSLKHFFTSVTDDKVIEKIQSEFRGFTGKRMAILIYLLEKEHKILCIDNNDRKRSSRKHFVNNLTNKNYKSIQDVNAFFESVSGNLKNINKDDSQYKTIKEELDKIVSIC